jgi:uncharacterized protein (DUF983 family)
MGASNPAPRTRRRELSWRTMVRSTLFGDCPNCVFGSLFDGPFRARQRCVSCDMCLSPDDSNWLGAGFLVYVAVLGLIAVEGVTLGLLFGLFSGFLWVLLLSAALFTVALYRPARGWWVWCLWTLGELS